MNIVEADASVEDLLANDPTVQLNGNPDEANGEAPASGKRYGQPLPKEWIPLYRKPMRTPTRKLRVVTIGAGIAALNLAYKVYHEHNLIEDGIVESLKMYEANDDLGGTWLVNTYPGVGTFSYTATFYDLQRDIRIVRMLTCCTQRAMFRVLYTPFLSNQILSGILITLLARRYGSTS